MSGEPPALSGTPVRVVRSGGDGRRLLAAAVTLPWLLSYGITGSWAVTRGASSAAAGLQHVDAGYSRLVTPAGLIMVGGLVLAAFAVVLALALLILLAHRGRAAWAAVAAAAWVLTAGAVWAAARGGLDPGLWVVFFAGVVYAAVLSVVMVMRLTRRRARGAIATHGRR